jgi:hypothetical protein
MILCNNCYHYIWNYYSEIIFFSFNPSLNILIFCQAYGLERLQQNVKHRGYKNFENYEDWNNTPPQGDNYEGQGSYSAWQRLTKRQSPMIQPSLEGNKFDRIMKRSFFNWINLPKRQVVNNGKEYSSWQRLTKRQVMSQPEVGEEQFQNIQRKSIHNNWLKLGYVTG